MPKTNTIAINSLKPKAQLTQSPKTRLKFLSVSRSLHLARVYLLLISLLSAIGLEIKNALRPMGATVASSHLLMNAGAYSAMALDVNGLKKTQSIFTFHQEAKQPILSFDLQKQSEHRTGFDPRGSALEAKAFR